MKLFRNILALMLALMLVLGMVACGGQEAGTNEGGNSTDGGNSTEPPVVENLSGVQAYVMEAKFNSDTVNQWKTIYLVDEDTYIITVYALDSKDNTKVTADFYMSGSYTLEGNLMTIQPGYGFTKALNGDTPIQMPVMPDENGGFSGMYYAMIGQFNSFVLNADGTWLPNEGDAEVGEAVNVAAAEAKKYVVEAKFNSDTVNQWKTIYLLDEDTYILTVYALDSKDNTKVTADFFMAGAYTLEGDTLTIQPGYGFVKALNGDTPIQMPVMPDENGGFSAMYYAMIGQFASFTLTEGTWAPVE